MDIGQIPDHLIRAYAAGEIGWREISAETNVDNFNIMLDGLASVG